MLPQTNPVQNSPAGRRKVWGKPFKKGEPSANPKGRPKNIVHYDPDFARLRPLTEEACAKLADMMRGYQVVPVTVKGVGKKPDTEKLVKVPVTGAVQLAAIGMLLERAWGKAPQALDVNLRNQTPEDESNETDALETIRRSLAGIAARVGAGVGAEVIDLEPSEGPSV